MANVTAPLRIPTLQRADAERLEALNMKIKEANDALEKCRGELAREQDRVNSEERKLYSCCL